MSKISDSQLFSEKIKSSMKQTIPTNAIKKSVHFTFDTNPPKTENIPKNILSFNADNLSFSSNFLNSLPSTSSIYNETYKDTSAPMEID